MRFSTYLSFFLASFSGCRRVDHRALVVNGLQISAESTQPRRYTDVSAWSYYSVLDDIEVAKTELEDDEEVL